MENYYKYSYFSIMPIKYWFHRYVSFIDMWSNYAYSSLFLGKNLMCLKERDKNKEK